MIWAPCGSLQLWGGGRWVGGHLGAWGVSLDMCTCTCMHTHARNTKDKHVRKLQMAATMEAAMFIMFNMHACVCACACACMHAHVHAHMCGGCLHPTPPPQTHPPTPQGGYPPKLVKMQSDLNESEYFDFV